MHSREIEQHKRVIKLNQVQREVLVGILLGDACLETRDRGRTYRLKVEQSAKHEVYVRHLRDLFNDWVLSGPRQRCNSRKGVDHVSWVFNSVSHPALRFFGQQFYADGTKHVPQLIHRWLTPRGLAYWFMDDGSTKSKQSKGVIFNTHGFKRSDIDRLIKVLSGRFELKCSARRQNDGHQIYVSGESFEQLLKWIDPFIISEMRYKVPHVRRTSMPKM
jgi:hypothetical protein